MTPTQKEQTWVGRGSRTLMTVCYTWIQPCLKLKLILSDCSVPCFLEPIYLSWDTDSDRQKG